MFSPAAFGPGHFAGVSFMVHPQQMEHSVQQENADFLRSAVAMRGRLFTSAIKRNSDFTKRTHGIRGWERKHIGGFVFSPEPVIELAQVFIRGDQTGEIPALRDFLLHGAGELEQRAAQDSWGGNPIKHSASLPGG